MKPGRNRPIGVFDSGIGGLTVVKSLRKLMPGESIIYFGDTARVPYGNKSAETVKCFSREIMDFMLEKNVKMIVVACNTASSLALSALKREYTLPVTGVIAPGVKEAVRITKNGRIGVIGTDSTISSRAYDKELKRRDRKCRLFSRGCPLFVPLVENRFFSDPVTYDVAGRYLSELKKRHIDTLILGCTHYPLLKNAIGDIMKKVNLVDSASSVAKMVKQEMDKRNIGADRKKRNASVKCFVSDDAEGFRRTARIFLREKISVKKVAL